MKGAVTFKLKKAAAPDPWRAELVDSVIEVAVRGVMGKLVKDLKNGHLKGLENWGPAQLSAGH